MPRLVAFLLQLSILITLISCSRLSNLSQLKIETLERTCDMTSQYVKCSTNLRLKNNGEENVNKFYFTVSKKNEPRLYNLIFTAGGNSAELKNKIIEDLTFKQKYNNITVFEVTLNNYIPSGEKISINVQDSYYNRMEPFPKKIGISV